MFRSGKQLDYVVANNAIICIDSQPTGKLCRQICKIKTNEVHTVFWSHLKRWESRGNGVEFIQVTRVKILDGERLRRIIIRVLIEPRTVRDRIWQGRGDSITARFDLIQRPKWTPSPHFGKRLNVRPIVGVVAKVVSSVAIIGLGRAFATDVDEAAKDLIDAALVNVESGDSHQRCSDQRRHRHLERGCRGGGGGGGGMIHRNGEIDETLDLVTKAWVWRRMVKSAFSDSSEHWR